jgi:glycosyltransferase involved in cell wall biosynthesis
LALALFPKGVYYAYIMEDLGVDHIQANFVWLEALIADVIRQLTGITYTVRPHAFGLFGRDRRDVRLQLERADRVITISEYHRRFIEEMSPLLAHSEIDVVHCAVDTDEWKPVESEAHAGEFRILSVGRPVPKKGHEILISACALLAQRGRRFRCRIVAGEGPLAEALTEQIGEEGIGEFVEVLPFMDEEPLRTLFEGSDTFALACVVAPNGDRDGIPVVLMEAMAAGLPVVSTDVSGIPELILDEETGLLVRQADPAALADALERLMDSPELRARLSQSGREHVVNEFSASGTAKEMAEIMQRFAPSV